MSLYNMLFGQSANADALLAVLGLTRGSVGRYRDCYLTEDGRIAVYTRNGGGNRECCHAYDPEYGDPECKNEPYQKTVKERLFLAKADWPNGKAPGNWFTSRDGVWGCEYNGPNDVVETWHRCLAPDSEECGCYGCVITYRLPKHPLYLSDEDDDYDCTYATIYFRIPETADREALSKTEPEIARNDLWVAAIDALRGRAAAPEGEKEGERNG